MRMISTTALLAIAQLTAAAQVYSPAVLRGGQIDTRSVAAIAKGIIEQSGARTDREKAEAVWRYFLTDGRFVKPGIFYHIAGWSYEEPQGEVLDPLKLLNSYGFGLCYQDAPLLAAVWEAAGFPARVWFLTGHTVAEVFYDGAYHHYDSDMLGYTTAGDGNFRSEPVASVRQLEGDGGIILRKLLSPTETRPGAVDYPWYPADLKAGAIADLAGLFATASDNRLYAFRRYPQGHTMDFVLRPGERLIRYHRPEQDGLCYLPFRYDGQKWRESPAEVPAYNVRTEDGPRSQKDSRVWGTGRIEYEPVLSDEAAYFPEWAPGFNENLALPDAGGRPRLRPGNADRPARAVFDMPSPFVIIDAAISVDAALATARDSIGVETSTDGGKTWDPAGTLQGPHRGRWETAPAVLARGEHGVWTAVSGSYGYLTRLTMTGEGAAIERVSLATRFQFNPRTLPALAPGRNEMSYEPGPAERRYVYPVRLPRVERFARTVKHARYISEEGQGYILPEDGKTAEFVFELTAPGGAELSAFHAGGRFLDLRDGLAPDKLTAEIRKTRATTAAGSPAASIEWSMAPEAGFTVLWKYAPGPAWKDGDAIPRLLRWPEVDEQVRRLPAGTRKVYVRYRLTGMALDDFRLSVYAPATTRPTTLEITHRWRERGTEKTHVERIARPAAQHRYSVETGSGEITGVALSLYCPPAPGPASASVTKPPARR